MTSNNNNEYFTQILLPHNQRLWLGLAFHAGYLNAAGFLACHRFVSHMTGFGAQAGINLGLNEYLYAFEMLLAPLFFIVGAAYAGTLVERKIIKHKRPKVVRGIAVIVLINILVLCGGLGGMFGEFGEPLASQRDFVLLFLLTFCCGLQNGLFVSLTGGQIRTTHITGLCTDIGLNFIKFLTLKDQRMKHSESKKNWLRIKSILGFTAGSLISALIFQKHGYMGFLGSMLIAFFLMNYVKWIMKNFVLVSEDPVEVRI